MRSRSATGFRLILGLGLPLGRPRCDAGISRAPCRSAYSIVGRVSLMRVSSMTRPSSSGTLKSTRMKIRRSLMERSRMESLDMLVVLMNIREGRGRPPDIRQVAGVFLEPFAAQVIDQVANAAGVSPLIVVPGDHLDA